MTKKYNLGSERVFSSSNSGNFQISKLPSRGIPSTTAAKQSLRIAHHPQLLSNPNLIGNYPRFREQQPPPPYVPDNRKRRKGISQQNVAPPQLPANEQIDKGLNYQHG